MVDIISNGHNWLILSVPLHCPYIAVQDQTIYVAGHASAVAEAHEQLQAYVYDVSTNHWRQLPTPGQYYGTPCIFLLLLVDIFSNAMNRTMQHAEN